MQVVKVGKNGLTEGAVREIRRQLEKKKDIEVILPKSVFECGTKKEFAEKIAEKTGGEIKRVIGHKIYLQRTKKFSDERKSF